MYLRRGLIASPMFRQMKKIMMPMIWMLRNGSYREVAGVDIDRFEVLEPRK